MPITTVVGASARIFAVTVDGAQAYALANQYSSAVQGISGLTSYNMVPGANSSGVSGVAQGAITQGGAYSITDNTAYVKAGSYDTAVDTLNGAASLDLTGATASSISVLTGDWGGFTLTAGSQSGVFIGGVGNNVFAGTDKTGSWNIATGFGNDTINATNGNNTIDGGLGNNLINLGSGTNVVRSEGTDTITGNGGTDTVTLLGSNSLVSLGSSATVYDTTSNNSVTVGSASQITGGSSGTYLATGTTSTIYGGTNDTISATHGTGWLQQVGGQGNTLSVSGSLTFIGGTGDTNITAGNATMFGAGGLNGQFDGTSGYSLFVGNEGNETINAASSHGSMEAFAGSGLSTLVGGSGKDTLVGGSGNATFTGGSGAANLFALNKGLAGAEYTITDFGSAAGNLMALYGYGLQNNNGLQNVLNNATHQGSNTTISLSDGSKITFQGITDLKASDFNLS